MCRHHLRISAGTPRSVTASEILTQPGSTIALRGSLVVRGFRALEQGARQLFGKRGSCDRGAELIVPSFGELTVPITGTSRSTGEPDIRSGLVVDATHIITNAHAVEGMELDSDFAAPCCYH
jgi:hypothetical protein